MTNAVSKSLAESLQAKAPFFAFLTGSEWSRRQGDPGICDFVTGEPQEMPLSAYVDALSKHCKPTHPHWFGYKTSEASARSIVSEAVSQRLGVRFPPEHVFMTNGAIAGLTVVMRAVVIRPTKSSS